MKPTPAPRHFPFPEHRTMAEVLEYERALRVLIELYGDDHPLSVIAQQQLAA